MKQAAWFIALNLAMTNVFLPLLPPDAFPGLMRFVISMWMPAATAVVFTLLQGDSLKETLNLKAGDKTAYLAAAAYAVAVAAITAVLGLSSGHLQRDPAAHIPLVGGIATLAVWTLSSLGEELGWRGYLHNHLKSRRHAPLLVGLVWAAWHFRGLVVEEHAGAPSISVFFAAVVLVSYFLAWLIETGHSVFACGLFHGVWNFLRMKLLFGNPSYGVHGLFTSDAPLLTEMEGVFGLVGIAAVGGVFVCLWYRHFDGKRRESS